MGVPASVTSIMPPRSAFVLVVLLAGCAPQRTELQLIDAPVPRAAGTDYYRDSEIELGSARVVGTRAWDGCPGICTTLSLRHRDGSISELVVPGGVLADRARIVGHPVPRVGEVVVLRDGRLWDTEEGTGVVEVSP